METAIIDYGMGNLLSVQRAFEKCGSDAVIIDNPLELRSWCIPGCYGKSEEKWMDRGVREGSNRERNTTSWNMPGNAVTG